MDLYFGNRGKLERFINDPAVMGKENDLGSGGQLSQDLQGCFGTGIIGVHQDVVQDEGHGFMVAGKAPLQRGQTQGKVELVAGAGTHPFHQNPGAVRLCSDQHRLALVIFICQ